MKKKNADWWKQAATPFQTSNKICPQVTYLPVVSGPLPDQTPRVFRRDSEAVQLFTKQYGDRLQDIQRNDGRGRTTSVPFQ